MSDHVLSNLSNELEHFSNDFYEGLDGGSVIHCSLKIWPIIHLIKILGYSLK